MSTRYSSIAILGFGLLWSNAMISILKILSDKQPGVLIINSYGNSKVSS